MKPSLQRKLSAITAALFAVFTLQIGSPTLAGNGNGDDQGNKNHGHGKHGQKSQFSRVHFNKDRDDNGNGHFHFHMRQPFPPDRNNPFINVKSAPYKAKGDGTTDDTAAIQQAANDALAQHKFVFFPAGTYLHTGMITFNGVAVTGVGAPTTLLANNEDSSAIVLTGTNPSINNLVISTQGVTGDNDATPSLSEGTVVVANATGFTVSNVTIVQGMGELGVYVFNSSVGTVSSAMFDGTGNLGDIGVLIDEASNVSVIGNMFQNEDTGVSISAAGFTSSSIAVLLNAIGNSSFPTHTNGVLASGVMTLDVSENSIQMANSNSLTGPISLTNCDAFVVSQNNINGGAVGISASGSGPNNANSILQNMVNNCGGAGISLNNGTTTAIQLNANMLATCGVNDTGSGNTQNAVILINGASSSGNTTVIINNAYQGPADGLNFYISSAFHIPAANVTGNTQTTALPNNLP
jgi:hypothetical protein